MATKTTITKELTVDLKDTTGEYNRVLRIPNPVNNITRAQVEEALAPAINSHQDADPDSPIVPFFYDDYDASVGLTVLGDIEIIEITKKVTTIA